MAEDYDPTSIAQGFARRDAEFAGFPVGRGPDRWTQLQDENARLRADVDRLQRELEAERAPNCFACGAKVTEICRRPGDRDCGREFEGGSRAARSVA